MKRVLGVGLALGAIALTGRARADDPPPVVDCSAVEARVAELQRRAEEAERTGRAAAGERAVCSNELDQTRGREKEKEAEATAAKSARAELCASVGRFADAIAEGSVDPATAAACVSAGQKARIQGLLDGAKNAGRALGQLSSYALGDLDQLPTLGYGRGTAAERQLARLFPRGRGTELLYRRLLVQALRDIAPATLADVASGGAASIDAFFARGEALDPRVVPEVQKKAQLAGDQRAAGASLARALRLVQAFQIMGGCAEGALSTGAQRPAGWSNECGVARKLAQLLESSGPLVLRQRVQRVWDTPCEQIDRAALSSWLADVATSTAGAADAHDWTELLEASSDRLFLCFLDAPGAAASYASWLGERLPAPAANIPPDRVDAMAARVEEGGDETTCARAVRAMQRLPEPTGCAVDGVARDALEAFAASSSRARDARASVALRACDRLARQLFSGAAASLPHRFDAAPAADGGVRVDAAAPVTRFAMLRAACDERRGAPGTFHDGVLALARVAAALGESPADAPWRVAPGGAQTTEEAHLSEERTLRAFATHAVAREGACDAMGMTAARCAACAGGGADHHDCAVLGRLQRVYRAYTVSLAAGVASLVAIVLALAWWRRLRAARRAFGGFADEARGHVERIGLRARPHPLRWLFPSRLGEVEVALPASPSWERWGDRAVLVRGGRGARVTEHDVSRAGSAARAANAQVAVLIHDDGANPDLAAVRALLDWAARGSSKAVRVLPLSAERLKWSTSEDDLLDLIEETSIHGNPFDVRGRITSSGQFFARERLVSGLLASVQAGQWVVVTGLRRFGKSSLTLEVARRSPGPYGYVDLAGFHHEIALARDPERAANAILRHVCSQLSLSASAKFPGVGCPAPPAEGQRVDAALLGAFMRSLHAWVAGENGGRRLSALVILDEVEQAIGVGADRLGHALDVLAIVVGRLRHALADEARPTGARSAVLLASALHPVLWAPLDVLAHQSIMGTFDSVSVAALPEDAAASMMRGLGARQGIRFTDDALALLVRESQGIPLVLRRLGVAVLDLYDAERARQGSLGAVEIGVEGARLAVRREEERGAPSRVWIESEIADMSSPVGALLRDLARAPSGVGASARELRRTARRLVLEQLAASGVDRRLSQDERLRRAEEAASVFVRQLGATGLLITHGDPLEPEAYELPAGLVRRALSGKSDEADVDAA